jgi:hypothetical protein
VLVVFVTVTVDVVVHCHASLQSGVDVVVTVAVDVVVESSGCGKRTCAGFIQVSCARPSR